LKQQTAKPSPYGNGTTLRFSETVSHGTEDSLLGWVIMALVEYEDERFMFAPDIQGPISNHTLELILASKPSVAMLGGPPFYLSGFRVEPSHIEQGTRNFSSIVETVPLTILEHHSLRDESWRQHARPVYDAALKTRHSVMTAAEYAGKENLFLESKRKQLFHDSPPLPEFKQWMKSLNSKKIVKPPI
jgi:predicted metallo-beta-lactamase superfamily hydrolase